MRTTETGATRDKEDGKLAYGRFLSPRVIRRYCEYLQVHRKQADGKLRDPDNWKKGMPVEWYRESLLRHVHEVWELTAQDGSEQSAWEREGNEPGFVTAEVLEDALCATIFNAMGMLFEVTRPTWLRQQRVLDLDCFRTGGSTGV